MKHKFDANELMRKLQMNANDPKTQAAMNRLQSAMRSAEGQRMAKQIDRSTAERIERAAKAAQAGDARAAREAVGEILKTPEGAALAAQLQKLLGK